MGLDNSLLPKNGSSMANFYSPEKTATPKNREIKNAGYNEGGSLESSPMKNPEEFLTKFRAKNKKDSMDSVENYFRKEYILYEDLKIWIHVKNS